MSEVDNNEHQTPQAGLDPQLAAQLVSSQISEPKSSLGLFELPCGYIDDKGELHTEIKVREITGHEEDMLANPKIKANKKMNELIARCIERIGSITDRGKLAQAVLNMTVGDRLFAIFCIRRVTVGDPYTYEVKCPQCTSINRVTIDLSDLDVKEMPDRMKREFEITLPRSKKEAIFTIMTGKGEEKLASLSKRTDDSLSLALLMRVTNLEGVKPTLKTIKDLSSKDRTYIRDQFTKVEGGVETLIDLDCPECFAEFKEELDVGQAGFFFPTVVQES